MKSLKNKSARLGSLMSARTEPVTKKKAAKKKTTTRASAEDEPQAKPSSKKTTKKTTRSKGAEVRAPRTATKKKSGTTRKAVKQDKAIEAVLAKMEHPVAMPIQVSHPRNCIHSGLFLVDLVTCGGYRKGRMYTIIGRPSHGKSTMVQEAIAAAQMQGIRIFHFDMEHASSGSYMQKQGIITDDSYRLDDGSRGYYYLDPETGEDFYRMALRLLKALEPDLDPETPPKTILLCDSYESFTSEAVDEDKNPIGTYARMHSQWQKMLRRAVRRAGAVMVATNQVRTSGIGSFFVDEEDDAGGYALKFYSDCRLFVRMAKPGTQKMPDGVGKITYLTKRNRMADPFKKEFGRLIIGRGFDRLDDRLQFLVTIGEIKIVNKRFVIDGKKLQHARARQEMKKTTWVDLCFAKARSLETYESYFKVDDKKKTEAWEEDDDA